MSAKRVKGKRSNSERLSMVPDGTKHSGQRRVTNLEARQAAWEDDSTAPYMRYKKKLPNAGTDQHRPGSQKK